MNSRPSIAYRSTFLGVATMELVPLGHTRVISRSPRHGWVIVTNNCTCSRTNKFKPEMSFFVTTKCQTHVLLVINEIFKKKCLLNNQIIAFIILNVYDNYSGTNFSKLAIWKASVTLIPVWVIVRGWLVPFGIWRWISSLEYRYDVIHGTVSHIYTIHMNK